VKNFYQSLSELTEITETTDDRNLGGWILYDGDCRTCRALAKTFNRLFRRRGFYFVPLQAAWVQRRLGLGPNAPLEELRVLTRDGRDLGGADAVMFLARQIWWARPFYALAHLPGIHRLTDRVYRWIAAHRGCTHIRCATSQAKEWPGWLGLVLLPMLALPTRNRVAPWIFMWTMAGAIFLGCKWLTFWRALRLHADLHLERLPGYFVFGVEWMRRPFSHRTLAAEMYHRIPRESLWRSRRFFAARSVSLLSRAWFQTHSWPVGLE
jgi:predicted DCC family thiol-disulfide oxidoreductase YuxK